MFALVPTPILPFGFMAMALNTANHDIRLSRRFNTNYNHYMVEPTGPITSLSGKGGNATQGTTSAIVLAGTYTTLTNLTFEYGGAAVSLYGNYNTVNNITVIGMISAGIYALGSYSTVTNSSVSYAGWGNCNGQFNSWGMKGAQGMMAGTGEWLETLPTMLF